MNFKRWVSSKKDSKPEFSCKLNLKLRLVKTDSNIRTLCACVWPKNLLINIPIQTTASVIARILNVLVVHITAPSRR